MELQEILDTLKGLSQELVAYKLGGPFANAVQEAARLLVAQGEKIVQVEAQNRWIPVTERVPEVSGRYLCNVKSFAFPGCFDQAILQYDKYGFREGHIYTDAVTHWMELFDPPKEENRWKN